MVYTAELRNSIGVIPVSFLNTLWKYGWDEKARWLHISEIGLSVYLKRTFASRILQVVMYLLIVLPVSFLNCSEREDQLFPENSMTSLAVSGSLRC